ncbi:hypothetical protein SLS55_002794 [Diplodia seriata]|uniref:Protein kinase domain-containing protein n=1 Tax=Diplodia seriata TaxID=420778 RepID=A0ABR3CLC8_9PEZI
MSRNAKKGATPWIDWYEIQPSLGNAKGRVLLIIDCCFAAQAMRSPRNDSELMLEMVRGPSNESVVPPNVELWMSSYSDTNAKVPLRSGHSFTSILIEYLTEKLRDEGSSISVLRANKFLCQQNSGYSLHSQPLHLAMEGDYLKSVEIHHFHKDSDHPSLQRESDSLKDISLSIYGPFDNNSTSMLLDWLTAHPDCVAGIEVNDICKSAKATKQYISGPLERGSSAASLQFAPNELQARVWGSWQGFLSRLYNLSRLWPSDHGYQQPNARMIEDLRYSWMSLRQVLERIASFNPDLLEDEMFLSQALNDHTLQNTGIARMLSILTADKRDEDLRVSAIKGPIVPVPESKSSCALMMVTDGNKRVVLVEYKKYRTDLDDHGREIQPFLCGFDFSRPIGDTSTTRTQEDAEYSIYRHPERQFLPTASHTFKHDVYSFGVVLYELGLWEDAEQKFAKPLPSDREGARKVRAKFLEKKNVSRLQFYVGTAYEDAVSKCLSGEGMDGHAAAVDTFEEQVLKKLHDGRGL